MRILIVSQYFWPENFKINDLALELNSRGHNVTVLTGQPNYPEGKYFKGYSFSNPKQEIWNNVEINRIPLTPRKNSKGINLIVNYISFIFWGIVSSRKRLKGKNFDFMVVFGASPITVLVPAIWLNRKYKIPIYLWVLDLWPETLYALGIIKSDFWKKRVERFVENIYRKCDNFLITSKSFSKSLVQHGVSPQRINYLPNWAEDIFTENRSELVDKTIDEIFRPFEGKFKIMFAGNIGEAQDIDSVIKTVGLLRDREDIVWLFVGDGRHKSIIEKSVQTQDLTQTVFLLGKYPLEKMPYFFSKADAMLVSLKSDPVFSLTVPAKVQAYMASKKPILTMLSGEGNSIISEANCGFVCESGDYEGLSKNVLKISSLSKFELDQLGLNGFNYYITHFEKNKLIDELEHLFNHTKS